MSATVGVNIHRPRGEQATADVAEVVALGAGIVRVDIDWHGIERQRGRFQWWDCDDAIRAATAAGVEVLANVYSCPPWTRTGDRKTDPPTEPGALAGFVDALLQRHPSIRYVGAWNEPDRAGITPADYERLIVRPMRRAALVTQLLVGPEVAEVGAWFDETMDRCGDLFDVVAVLPE